MNFNPPPSVTPNSNSSNTSHSSGARLVRGQPSAWGLPAPGTSTRRGLTPLATNLTSSSSDSPRVKNTSTSNSNPIASPFASTFSSVLTSTLGNGLRASHSSSFSASPSNIQTGSQQAQPGQLLLSPRSRAITPSSNPQSASSAAASTTASQVGGGGSGGGGGSFGRNPAFSPSLPQHTLTSPTANTFERAAFSGSASSSSSSQSSVSKIVVAQIYLLLGSITEKEGKTKWETQAEAIRKLVESNGMDTFPKYFRRLLVGNSPQIFPGINRNVENPGNYQMLVQEMDKIQEDPGQAARIAEAIDTSEGDIFRDFDLATFMDHFKLDILSKILLLSALTRVARQDLKTKAATLIMEYSDSVYEKLANARNDDPNVPPHLLATCAIKFIEDIPRERRTEREFQMIRYTLNLRYSKQTLVPPPEIQTAFLMLALLQTDRGLLRDLRQRGPQATANLEAAKALVSGHHDQDLDENQVSGTLFYIILNLDWYEYNLTLFVSAIREYAEKQFEWHKVVQAFDQPGVGLISKDRFLALYSALLPVAREDPTFDIQALWGGEWSNHDTQRSFLRAFVSCSPSELDASTIPGLRRAYDPREFLDGSDNAAKDVEAAERDPMISLDAVTAIINLYVPEGLPLQTHVAHLRRLLDDKIALFLCSSAGIPKPWPASQLSLMQGLLRNFLNKSQPEYPYVLRNLWKQDKHWVATNLIEVHMEDPLELTTILDLALELDWMNDLFTLMNGFGFDFAALAHRKDLLDFGAWAKEKMLQDQATFINGLHKFLLIKAQDELRISRDEQPEPQTVSLSMRTAYEMVAILDEHMKNRVEFKGLQRQCLQAYPRLILLCGGISENIDVGSRESNAMPRTADAEMQEMYKRMYSTELSVPRVLEYLQEWKGSDDPAKVDLFACMIHGLFDEFSCFNEYPLNPLATTAVLFGGIMQLGLISDLTLRVAQDMILDSVRDFPPEASMYKFGLQALITIAEKLHAPDWTDYCLKLVKIPGLKGTQAYSDAMEGLAENGVHPGSGNEPNGVHGVDGDAFSNGEKEEYLGLEPAVEFKSVNAGPAPSYDEPDEETKDKVVFFFNNVSEQNLGSKFEHLQKALQDEHFGWFANFLVDGRAKVEPNYQPLYMEMLQLLGKKDLWNEVLRETYLVIQRLLNSDSTMHSASERKNLKNLAVWLGSLTLARDKPVKYKNISFMDLLSEGHQLDKLLLIIPFICNVLAQGERSTLFKPPNPWVVEVIAALVELYYHFEIKLNQKFEIEVLCKEFGLNVDSIEPSTNLRARPLALAEGTQSDAVLHDDLDGFDDLSLSGINRSVNNPRFDLDALSLTLPDFESRLAFPPATGSPASQARLRQVVRDAVKTAILEILSPVVERSVTIATITTSKLIHKDFAREPDEDRIRKAAQQMVRQLSGSLALATCKEPLKMSMTNYIRMSQADLPEPAFAEGTILMCVNDNIDIACKIVEEQAEERSMPEIESHIEAEIATRRQHRAEHPNEPFVDSAYNRWAGYIPDPYKQSSNGLAPEQLAIYFEFARQSRGPANHAQTSSADSGRQLPDVLQDTFSSMSNVHTPSEHLAIPHQPSQVQQHTQMGRMLPPPVPASIPQAQTNGFMDPAIVEERVQDNLNEINRILKDKTDQSSEDYQIEGSVIDLLNQTWDLIVNSPDSALAMNTAEYICKALYGPMNHVQAEIFVQLLSKLYQSYPGIRREVANWAAMLDEEKMMIPDVTIALLSKGILQLKKVDGALARMIGERDESAIESFSNILDALLLNPRPSALRADFANSMGALGQWYMEAPHHGVVRELVNKLKFWGIDDEVDSSQAQQVKKYQTTYVFAEWIRLCETCPDNLTERVFGAFMAQLHIKELVRSPEDMASFLRQCIDDATENHEIVQERLNEGQLKDFPNKAFLEVDWLARFIVALVRSQGQVNGSSKGNKAAFMDSILSLLTLIMNSYQVMQGDRFSQRAFFRLVSSIICDWHDFGRESPAQDRDMLLVFAGNILTMGPRYFPGFVYGWFMLFSHRFFMPALLKLPNDEGWDSFARILEAALSYITKFLTPTGLAPWNLDLYRGLLRTILILHHDFPEFLAENHFRLCNAVPAHCTQLLNLILSAYPSSFPELPDPFIVGLKVDRLEEMRKAPRISGDFVSPLIDANIKDVLDAALRSSNITNDTILRLADAAYVHHDNRASIDTVLLHSLVLYIGQSATATASQRGSQPFVSDSPQATLLGKLVKELPADVRYYLLCAMVNQLRYPNSYTQYFSYALLHLFGTDGAGHQESLDMRQQITRVLMERLHVVRPHPWGLVITMCELFKNPEYTFWQLPFVKRSNLLQAACDDLLKSGDEPQQRWPLGQFSQHI